MPPSPWSISRSMASKKEFAAIASSIVRIGVGEEGEEEGRDEFFSLPHSSAPSSSKYSTST